MKEIEHIKKNGMETIVLKICKNQNFLNAVDELNSSMNMTEELVNLKIKQ